MGIRKMIAKKMLKTWKEHDDKILAARLLPEGVVEVSDIPYMDDGNSGHLLDVYYPKNTNKKLPVIIDIHGGGFLYGDKELNKSFCYFLALQGFTVLNVNYRLAPNDAKVLGQIQDIVSAIHWISSHIESFPADPSQAFIVGDSAGGVLAVMAALIAKSERLQKIFNTKSPGLNFKAISIISGMMSFDKNDFLFRGMRSLCFEKGYKKQEYYQNMSFSNLPEMKELPPVFLATSEEDELCSMTLDFEKTLNKINAKSLLKYYPKKDTKKLGHIFSVQYPEYDESKELLNEMIKFFKMAARA